MKRYEICGLIIFLLGVILSTIVIGCRSTENSVHMIIVRNYNEGYYSEYKVDLVEKEYFQAVSIHASDDVEEYTYIDELTDEKIAAFLCEVEKYGMLSWDENYFYPKEMFSEYSWSIIIHYSDSTKKESHGAYGNFPESWDDMFDAFYELTGDFVLSEKRPMG